MVPRRSFVGPRRRDDSRARVDCGRVGVSGDRVHRGGFNPSGPRACTAAATGFGGQKPASSWRASPKRGVQCRARRRARPCGAVCGAVLGPRVVGRRRTLRFGPPGEWRWPLRRLIVRCDTGLPAFSVCVQCKLFTCRGCLTRIERNGRTRVALWRPRVRRRARLSPWLRSGLRPGAMSRRFAGSLGCSLRLFLWFWISRWSWSHPQLQPTFCGCAICPCARVTSIKLTTCSIISDAVRR